MKDRARATSVPTSNDSASVKPNWHAPIVKIDQVAVVTKAGPGVVTDGAGCQS